MSCATGTYIYYPGNSGVLQIDALKNAQTDAYINDATVEATLVDRTDTEVSGQTWPLTLSYVAASDGTYRGVVEEDLSVVVSAPYTAKITVTSGVLVAYWELPITIRTREC